MCGLKSSPYQKQQSSYLNIWMITLLQQSIFWIWGFGLGKLYWFVILPKGHYWSLNMHAYFCCHKIFPPKALNKVRCIVILLTFFFKLFNLMICLLKKSRTTHANKAAILIKSYVLFPFLCLTFEQAFQLKAKRSKLIINSSQLLVQSLRRSNYFLFC